MMVKILVRVAIGFGVAAAFAGLIGWVLSYRPASGAEAPNVTDWMQGWGSLFGLVAATGAALAAGAVYWQGVEAVARAEARRLEDRAEAAEAAQLAEDRWRAERSEAAAAASAAEQRWRAELDQVRRAAFTDQLLNAVGEMIGALAELSDAATRLSGQRDGEEASRSVLRDMFSRFARASTRVGILEFSLIGESGYGDWLRSVANNLSADLLQANDFAPIARRVVRESRPHDKPIGTSDGDWAILSRSLSYWSVQMVGLDPPGEVPSGFEPLPSWWARKILRAGTEPNTVYSLDASYFVQIARLLDDFTREYLDPWAKSLVTEALGVRRRGSGDLP